MTTLAIAWLILVTVLIRLLFLACLFDWLRTWWRARRAFWAALRASRALTAEQQQARRRILAGILQQPAPGYDPVAGRQQLQAALKRMGYTPDEKGRKV